MDIKNIVGNGNKATFSHYRQGHLYYTVLVNLGLEGDGLFIFPIAVSSEPKDAADIGGATFHTEEKAITLMRYIRKAIADGTFVKA